MNLLQKEIKYSVYVKNDSSFYNASYCFRNNSEQKYTINGNNFTLDIYNFVQDFNIINYIIRSMCGEYDA
jgi:hypothetical protein